VDVGRGENFVLVLRNVALVVDLDDDVRETLLQNPFSGVGYGGLHRGFAGEAFVLAEVEIAKDDDYAEAVGGVDETSGLAPCRFTGRPIIPCARYAGRAAMSFAMLRSGSYLVLGRKIPKLLILNDISSISQDEDLFDTVFRWPKSAKNGIFDEFPQNLRFLKIGEYH